MRKCTAVMIAAVMAAVCTGCRSKMISEGSSEGSGSAGSSIAEAASAVTESTVPAGSADAPEASTDEQGSGTENSSEERTPDGHIDIEMRSVIWRGSDGYFIFYPDGVGGCTMSFENGTGVAFEYEANPDGSTTFHMGAADNSISSEAVNNPDGTMTVSWGDGRTEVFAPVNANAEEFTFYTNEELQYIALAYYQSVSGYTPQYSGVQSNDDGRASIQLYDMVDDHSSTSAWYTVDRVTLIGTDDISGSQVDMTAFADMAKQAYQ